MNLFLFTLLLTGFVPGATVTFKSYESERYATQLLPIKNLWVDAVNGNDISDGMTPITAFRSIQKAADIAMPGTIVHILPGIYRETVQPLASGNSLDPIKYYAEGKLGTVIIRGSESSSSMKWTQLTTNSIGLPSQVDPTKIYYTDLSAWALKSPPRFLVQLNGSDEVAARYPLAREPDWQVDTDWKYHEFWWSADGGSIVAECDPSSDPDNNCDISSRSTTQLTHIHNNIEPAGIEAGNLTSFGDLTGATLVALDTVEGHYVFRREIVSHDVPAGTITVDMTCEFDRGSGKPGLGWGSKYYIENHPALLDTPGEWWYDTNSSRLYLWPTSPGNPATMNIEISLRNNGFRLFDKSYIKLNGLTLEFFNESAFHQSQSCPGCSSIDNTVGNSVLRYANIGIDLGQRTDYLSNITSGFTLENSEVSHMDTNAIYSNYWWKDGTSSSFTHAGITNTIIRNNELYDLGFRSINDNTDGIQFNYPDNLIFEGNHVYQVAHNGMVLGRSIIQSTSDFDFSADEIKTGNILIKDNLFERACLMATDCGELKMSGRVPDNYVFRDVLITGNIFRNTIGWAWVSEKRGAWSGGPNSEVQGMGGFGLYLDFASGVNIYRNIAYNNASSGFHFYSNWWDGDIIIYNNIVANSLNGIRLDGWASRGSVNTQIGNNLIINNEGYGILLYNSSGDYGDFILDNNLYFQNGWRTLINGGVRMPGLMAIYGVNRYYQTLLITKFFTPWEDSGQSGDPHLLDFNFNDHDMFDGSWPDFQLTSSSIRCIDQGTTVLPESLVRLLNLFEVEDYKTGKAYDIGCYEVAP